VPDQEDDRRQDVLLSERSGANETPRRRLVSTSTYPTMFSAMLSDNGAGGLSMSEVELAKNAPEVSRRSLLLGQVLPYIAVLTLAILGVAYTNISHQPLTGYWEFLALATGALCVVTAWGDAKDRQARRRLMGTQALHWVAILATMNIVLLSSVRQMLPAPLWSTQ